MSLILLSGQRHSGKTSLCRRLAEAVRERGLSAGGILSPAVIENGECVGYDVVDLATGRTRRLASLGGPGVEQVGSFHFTAEGLSLGRAALAAATLATPDLVIVDEVGPLELAGQGWGAHLPPLAATATVTVFSVRPSLTRSVAERWPPAFVHDVSSGAEFVLEAILAELRPGRRGRS